MRQLAGERQRDRERERRPSLGRLSGSDCNATLCFSRHTSRPRLLALCFIAQSVGFATFSFSSSSSSSSSLSLSLSLSLQNSVVEIYSLSTKSSNVYFSLVPCIPRISGNPTLATFILVGRLSKSVSYGCIRAMFPSCIFATTVQRGERLSATIAVGGRRIYVPKSNSRFA